MPALARKIMKAVLFVVIFFLAVMFVHTYPYPMPESQLKYWFAAADFLNISDPEDLYFPAMWLIDLIVAIIAYQTILKFGQRIKKSKSS